MEVKPGYKQTEVGVIPEDWDICTIQELIDRNVIIGHLDGNHGELYPRSHEFTDYGVPYITANDFFGRRVSFSNCKYLSEERARRFRKGVAKNGDVLFAHNATVGPTSLLSMDRDYVILSTTATYFRCNPEKLVNSLFLYVLQSPLFVHQYQEVMAQSTRNQVPITAQRKLSVVLPRARVEQEAIAEALSDADAHIESLEQLIAKKRHLKQGAMQELLTGKRRLSAFVVKTGYKQTEAGVIPEDWETPTPWRHL
jgi:type I restriction enzyme S subunit